MGAASAPAVTVGGEARAVAALSIAAAVAGPRAESDVARAFGLGAVGVPGDPVTALVDAARDADLLVVGSRGLHGVRALGSESERVAQRASCSLLVVRGSG